MTTLCIAGAGPGIGKTAVAELLLGDLEGFFAARVRVGDPPPELAERLAERGHVLVTEPAALEADAEIRRLLDAGAAGGAVLVAEPRGLEPGLEALAGAVPPRTNLLVEGGAFLWARDADVVVMVLGPRPSGAGMVPVKAALRPILPKVHVWAWNTRGDPTAEGFFDFPQALARSGYRGGLSLKADFHHVNPRDPAHAGNAALLADVRERLSGAWVRSESDEFLRRCGFDV